MALVNLMKRPFTSQETQELAETAAAYGLLTQTSLLSYANISVTLLPSVFPKAWWDEAFASQKAVNCLVQSAVNRPTWLWRQLESISFEDEFVGRLVALSQKVHAVGLRQPISLAVLRTDFLYDAESSHLKQVEINTISCALGSICAKVRDFHAYVLERHSALLPELDLSCLMENAVTNNIAGAMLRAHQLYGVREAVIVFVVPEFEFNLFDQKELELWLWRNA
jgi:glutathione synthase